MQLKEYIRLGNISLKNRKKSTRNTVCGIAFGLSLLVAVVFFSLAFSMDLTNAIDSARNVTCFAVPVTNERDGQDGYSGIEDEEFDGTYFGILFGDTERKALFAELGKTVEEIVSQEYVSVASDSEYSLNGQIFRTEGSDGMHYYQRGTEIKVLRKGNSGCIPAGIYSDLERAGHSFLAAGREFSPRSKGEIMVSEALVRINGMTPEEVVGGSLSLKMPLKDSGGNLGLVLDNDNDPDNAYSDWGEPSEKIVTVFKNYRIVGVISEAYYRLNDIFKKDAHIWITGDSFYGENSTLPKYAPILRLQTDERGSKLRVATYKDGIDAMQSAALADGMFFAAHPSAGFGYFYLANTDRTVYNAVVYFVQSKDFASSLEVAKICTRGFKRLGMNFDRNEVIRHFVCPMYRDFLILYEVGNYVTLFLYVFGGTIFFATLLNLYNSVQYSVQTRRRYLGMMRAIGAKKSVLPRLYLVEILLIFARSLPWTVCCGGLLSWGIKWGVDASFLNAETVFGVAIRLRFVYFFASLGIALAVMTAVALLFSRIALHGISRRSVVDVLSDEN